MRALRFARHWVDDTRDVRSTDTTVRHDGFEFPASVYRPPSAGPVPGWVLLHGITRPGRRHASLVRFASSLAASGAVVVVPEVREWVELRLAPDRTFPAIRAGLDFLEADGQARLPAGLMGFSFGSPQVVRAALDPGIGRAIGVVAAFGGYAELDRIVRFQLTGEHEWAGRSERMRPDPYGRWIIVANYLTRIDGYRDRHRVADALRALAARAGDLQIDSWDPAMDPTKADLRASLEGSDRDLFDLFAPPADRDPLDPAPEVDAWVERLVETARASDPGVELPRGELRPHAPVHIVHGASDHLIPVSEGHRLGERLRGGPGSFSVTPLFAHSAQDGVERSRVDRVRENLRFVRILDRILREV